VFHSGNVIINTGLDVPKSFQLHSNVLARHSSWFRSQFSNNADQAWHSFSLENVNGSIQLVRRQTNSDDDTRRTEQDEVPDLNTNKENICEYIDSNAISVSFASGSNGEQTTMVAFYYQIFGTFYGISPVISTTDLGSALIQAEGLVKSATNLDCLGPIRPYISSSLAQYRQKLFLAIKDDPARWIKLAVSVEDTSIFTECLIHLVGAHPHWLWPTNKTSLAAEYCQLVSKKSKELDQLCVEIDRDLLMITIEVGQGRNQEPVPCHRSLMETWMLVQLFRDTVSRSLHTINKPRQRSIERGSIYRKIHKGGSAYMEYEDVHCTCQGIMQTSWRDLGEELKVLKEYASEIVRDVAENELMIDPEAHKIGYLTCAKIKPEDIPWHGSSRRST
jgi:hypothetical protein